MEATVFPLAYATLEVLDLYNYDDWSLKVENYLIGEGLWDVVDATATTPNNDEAEYMNWRMKNSKALYAIQISCRTDVFSFIFDIKMAKDAWATLAKRLKPKNWYRSDIKGKAATLVPSVMFVLQALDKDNYKRWSFWVKRYLVAENLWEVVEGTRGPPNHEDEEDIFMAWRKNNARALHIIILFCGEDAESCITGSDMARDAWITLAEKFSTPETFETLEVNTEVDPSDDDASSNDVNTDLNMAEFGVAEDLKDIVLNSEWTRLREFVKQHPEAVRAKVTHKMTHEMTHEMTLLQFAIIRGQVEGVKELVNLMEKKDLDVVGFQGHTALSLAIDYGMYKDEGVEMVKCIFEKNKKLLYRVVNPSANTIPLLYALTLNRLKIAEYLYSVTPKLKTNDAAEVISICLRLKYLDLALKLLRRFPKLIVMKDHSGGTPLNELAGTRAGLFPNVRQLGIWKRLIYQWIHIPELPASSDLQDGDVSITIPKEDNSEGNQNQLIRKVNDFFSLLLKWMRSLTGFDSIYQMKFLHSRTEGILETVQRLGDLNLIEQELVRKALFQAVERGHFDIIKEIRLCSWCTESWWHALRNENGKTLLQYAIELRQDQIFHFIIICYGRKESQESIGKIDKFGSNMLHVVGKSASTRIGHIQGAALQMQYELQWFKKVEKLANPKDLSCVNRDGRTPREEFTFNHRDLVEAGQKSMKETATSSSTVAALIITIMFAAVVTVPGGIDGSSGIPIYLHRMIFRIFMVADAISLLSATTSVLVFLGILTSRFAENDFLKSLPAKLIFGFLTVCLSVGYMMIAFSAAVSIMLPEEPLIVIASTVLAGIPTASFLWMQFPFLIELFISTYVSGSWYDYRRNQVVAA